MSESVYEAKEPHLLAEAEVMNGFDLGDGSCEVAYAVVFRKKCVYKVEVNSGNIKIENVV